MPLTTLLCPFVSRLKGRPVLKAEAEGDGLVRADEPIIRAVKAKVPANKIHTGEEGQGTRIYSGAARCFKAADDSAPPSTQGKPIAT